MKSPIYLLSFTICLLPFAMTSAQALDSAGEDPGLYQQSIKSTKSSIDREMIEVLYHDALEAYHDQRYDEALELLDKIYALDPQYEDVAKLRTSIRKSQSQKESEVTLDGVKELMRKGDRAYKAGQNVAAINFWKQALDINPSYAPAQKKIQEVNQTLGRKEFESGYIHYRHGEMEDALDAWSNAIVLDPTYKQRGLLLLMSKVQIQVEHDQVNRLAAQGFDQYQQGLLEDALHTYQDLSKLEPRHEEARRMTAKIKIQLGQAALKAAESAMASHTYPEAIQQADKAIQYDYQISSAKAIKAEAEHAIVVASRPKPPKKVATKPAVATSSAPASAPEQPATPAAPRNPEEALVHYRKGLAAIRTKDYHLAMEELDIASQLDPANEHIYIARQRAQQEWASANNDANGTHP